MAEKRDQIRDYVLDMLRGVDSIATVKYGTVEPRHENKPVAALIPRMDDKSRASKTHDSRDWDVMIRLVVDDQADAAGIELDAICAEISALLAADRRLGGLLTDDLSEGATTWLYIDERWPQAGADIEFRLHYQV